MSNRRIFRPNARVMVADKTTPTRYAMHLSIMADWYPIIGSTGYDLYSLYVVLATLRLSLGARKIAKHLNISRSSVERYTNLLYIAGLIDVHPGNATQPNQIDIVDPPAVTMVAIEEIRQIVADDPVLGSQATEYWRGSLFKRLDNWQSLEDVLPAAIPYNGAGPGVATPAAAPARSQSEDREQSTEHDPELIAELMQWRETFTEDKARELLEKYEADQIRGNMAWIDANQKIVKATSTGLLLTMLRNGQWMKADEEIDLENQIPEHFRDIIQR